MKYQIRISYSVWQEAAGEGEALQVVMEGVPDLASHIKAEVVGKFKNPVALESPIEEVKK